MVRTVSPDARPLRPPCAVQVRLVMLFTLRFESDASRVRMLQELLMQAGVRDRRVHTSA